MELLRRISFRVMSLIGQAATPRDRQLLAIRNLDLKGLGLEIGPSHRPLAPKAQGFQVEVMDYTTREGLIRLYENMGVDTSKIEEVDHVWSGQNYRELVGGGDRFDWIIASHVFEHVPDLIGTLEQCFQILKPGGILSLALPHHRFCFDHDRPPSSLASVIDAHFRGDTQPTPGTIAEFNLRFAKKGHLDCWNPWHRGRVHRANPPALAKERLQQRLESKEYQDVHVWVFTPESFLEIIEDLRLLGLLDCEIVAPPENRGLEFFIQLRRKAARP